MSLNILFTARAAANGGRDGHTKSDDGVVDVNLTSPSKRNATGKNGTTPEHLFAAGYAACFASACDYAAREMKLKPQSIEVETAVGMGQKDAGGFALKVDINAKVGGLPREDAEKLVTRAHEVCPYSNAVRNNVEVGVNVTTV